MYVVCPDKEQNPAHLLREYLHLFRASGGHLDPVLAQLDDLLGCPKRYRGPAVTKTVQIQAQLSERLTGFVNSTGYTVKDVVNKAVEEFLERYGG